MTGTTRDLIPIVIVPVVALVYWLIMIYRANSHPQWGSQAPADTVSTHALEGSVPAQRPSSPGQTVPGQRPGTAGDSADGTGPQRRVNGNAAEPGFTHR
jgi:hypothetical protein